MDPGGHMEHQEAPPTDIPSPMAWMTNRYWLYGVDLFNHWYFWEATEMWSPLWAGLEKEDPAGLFVQAMVMSAGGILKAHCRELKGVDAFWKNADTLFNSITPHHKELWGLQTSRVHKDMRRFFKPTWKKGELPLLDGKVPKLKLPM
jgi:hypothetical protein